MTIAEKSELLVKSGVKQVKITYADGYIETARLFRSSSDEICKYKKGSTRRGYRLLFSEIVDITPIVSKKAKAKQWEDGWKKVKNRIEKSGLWANLIPDIDIALQMGYDLVNQASDDYWKLSYKEEEREDQLEAFLVKYPLLRYGNRTDTVNTTVIWQMRDIPRVKKMRFCKGSYNDIQLLQIKNAMDTQTKFGTSGRTNYDISFEYNPEKKLAWYSEEYKNCGNGHYYLAISSTHAIYWEKD